MRTALIAALLLAGCVQLPPSIEDIQAKKFQLIAGQSAVYIVRTPMDSSEPGSVSLNDSQVTTLGGTYYRWEVAPGKHHVSGFDTGSMTLTTAPGRIYFLEHTVIGDPDDGGVQNVRLREIGEQAGRNLVRHSQLLR